jgi:outer membrane biosynthesis protein TonB
MNSCPFVVRMTTGRDIRFWRNVVLIALAHVALIAGLIRWSVAARASTNAESIVWLGGAEELAAGSSENGETPSARRDMHPVQPKPLKDDEPEEEKPAVTPAKSEIELPSPTPKPTSTSISTPKLSATQTPKPKVHPKVIPKPTSKKILLAKASPKPLPKTKPSSTKSREKSEKSEKNLTAKTGAASQSGSGKTGSTAKGGSAGGGRSASEFGWYGNMLHDRFYSAWIQPTTSVPAGSKISTLVKVRIEKDGRVSKFEIIKPSENVVVNESVAAIAKRVTEVDAPPDGLSNGEHYDVKINFELNTEEGAPK